MIAEDEMESDAKERNPNTPIVNLPTLQHLSLTAPPRYSASLLSGIAVPLIRGFVLRCYGGEKDDFATLLSSLKPLLQTSTDRHFNHRLVLEVYLQYEEVEFRLKGISAERKRHVEIFTVSFVDGWAGDAMDEMGTILMDININVDHTTLHVKSMQDTFHPSMLVAVEKLPRVTRMAFDNCDVQWLLQVLTSPIQTELNSNEKRWIFANLEELEMDCCIFDPRQVLRMVKGRFGSQQHKEGCVGFPVWLKKLRISGRSNDPWVVAKDLSPGMMRVIQTMLGDDCLEWDVWTIEDSDDDVNPW